MKLSTTGMEEKRIKEKRESDQQKRSQGNPKIVLLRKLWPFLCKLYNFTETSILFASVGVVITMYLCAHIQGDNDNYSQLVGLLHYNEHLKADEVALLVVRLYICYSVLP